MIILDKFCIPRTVPRQGTEEPASRATKVESLFRRVTQGELLTPEEKSFLKKLSPSFFQILKSRFQKDPFYKLCTSAQQLSRRSMNISLQFLICDIKKNFSQSKKTDANVSHLAKLVLNLAHNLPREEPPPQPQELISCFQREKKRPISRRELIDFIRYVNTHSAPQLKKADECIAAIPFTERLKGESLDNPIHVAHVRYNRYGEIEWTDRAVSPLDFTCRQQLTAERREAIKDLYTKLSHQLPYNNLGEFLEWIAYIRSARLKSPTCSLQEIWNSYMPRLSAIFNTYRSGRCLSLATTFCEELAKRQILAVPIAHSNPSAWSCLPIPGSEKDLLSWNAFSQEMQGVHHTSVLVLFKDERESAGAMHFDCSFGHSPDGDIDEFLSDEQQSGIDQLKEEYGYIGSSATPNQVIDPNQIGKMHLRGRFKLVIGTPNEKILGVDLLKGNFYMNSSWVAACPHLPVNAKGQVSIDLASLARPDELGTYFIEGKKQELSHRDALHLLLEAARAELTLPPTMKEDLISLAQMLPELFENFLLEPLPLIRHYYEQLAPIGRTVLAYKKDMRSLEEDTSIRLKKYRILQIHNDIRAAIKANDPMQLEAALSRFQTENANLVQPV